MPQKNRTVKGVLGGLLGLVGLSAVAGLLVTASVTPVLAMTGIAGSQALSIFEDLPTYLKPTQPMAPTTFYGKDTNGKWFEFATFYEQNRTPVTLEQISPTLLDAVLSSEDKNFYSHGAINLGATVKAAFDNFRGTSSRGASTITQQYVKNALIQQCEQTVSPSDPEYAAKMEQCWRSYAIADGSKGVQRKLQEMRYAIQVEKDYSKNEILLGYLNVSNFGGTTYGIEAAANYYFNTTAAKVTLAQAATLAGMVQEPNLLRIDRPEGSWQGEDGVMHNSAEDGYETTKDRRDYVLGQMVKNGHITQEEYDAAIETPVEPNIHATDQGCRAAGKNAYFCQYVKSVLENDEAFGATDEERQENLRRGGMNVYTSLDMRVQQAAIDAVSEWAPATVDGVPNFGAAATSVEVGTGRILSIVQNTNFSEAQADAGKPGFTNLVYAADADHGSSIGFPVGSTYKLFTLLDWLEKGRSVNEVLDGRSRTFRQYTMCEQKVGNSAKIENFRNQGGYVGSVRKFTADSLNSGFLAMATQLDTCDINKVAARLGVHQGDGTPVTEDNTLYGSTLGSKNITPMELAGAFGTVASNGTYCEPRVIDSVTGIDGEEIAPPVTNCAKGTLTPEVAATAAYALEGVMTNGSGRNSNPWDGTPVLGKTGTHETYQTMMVESSTKVTTAVWVGNSVGEDNLYNHYWNGVQLSNLRHQIAPRIQHAANLVYGGDRFPQPDSKLTRTVLKDLPNVVGQTIEAATKTLQDAGFSVQVGDPVDSDQATNIVAAQNPPAGQAASGATITISPSNGQGAKVPDVTGQSKAEAQAALFGAGFTSIDFTGSCNAPESTVKSTSPAAGTATTKSSSIKVQCE